MVFLGMLKKWVGPLKEAGCPPTPPTTSSQNHLIPSEFGLSVLGLCLSIFDTLP